jgi:hypothetical protein
MPLFDHTGDKLAAGPALLLPADPGAALGSASGSTPPQQLVSVSERTPAP